jgi:phenylacetate-coenzyme A ligase PaaK-like adenylate-forming protein
MLNIHQIEQRIAKVYFGRQERILRSSRTDIHAGKIERRVLRAFRKAVRVSPAYSCFLREHGVTVSAIRTLADFQREVPLLDKVSFFSRFPAEEIFPGIARNCRGRVWSSSGTSGAATLGYDSHHSAFNALAMDFMFHTFFRTLEIKTLFINCLPAAWPIPSLFVQYAAVGPRSDAAISLIKRLGHAYGQFIIGGEPLFLKHLVEEAAAAGIDFSTTSVHLVVGGDYVAENYKKYLLPLINPVHSTNAETPRNAILGTMGMSELGVVLFFETETVAALRSLAAETPEIAQALAPEWTMFPELFQYNPFSTFVETNTNQRDGMCSLVLTNLNIHSELPLIRYDTGDHGQVYSFSAFESALARHRKKEDFSFEFPFPFVVTHGKRREIKLVNDSILDAAACTELIFSSSAIASRVTGSFLLHAPYEQATATLEIQLKPDAALPGGCETDVDALRTTLAHRKVDVTFTPYHQFHSGMGMQYDRKPDYLS